MDVECERSLLDVYEPLNLLLGPVSTRLYVFSDNQPAKLQSDEYGHLLIDNTYWTLC